MIIKPFRNSDKEFELLYQLENALESHVKDWGSPEMLKYGANLIPEKCNAECEFLEIDGARSRFAGRSGGPSMRPAHSRVP